MSPSAFGKYAVLEKIGAGGFGAVYKGRDPNLKRVVAIKVLIDPTAELENRFLREAEISAGLQHPNITTVYDFGLQDGRPYLVQEFLPGEDLDRLIARRDPVLTARRLDWLTQIAEALHYAHERGVVHRDLKPANVRLVDGGPVKLMDFGIAKLMTADEQLTRTGMSMGTIGYLAPEQLQGAAVDRRADIFSFGVLAYEVLSYQRPFQGDNASAVLYQIAHVDPLPLPSVWPACPPRLQRLLERCLAKQPEGRPADLGPVIAELRAVREQVVGSPGGAAGPAAAVLGPDAGEAEPPRPGTPDPGAADGRTYRTALRLPGRGGMGLAVGLLPLILLLLLAWWLWPSERAGDGTAGSASRAASELSAQAGAPGDRPPGEPVDGGGRGLPGSGSEASGTGTAGARPEASSQPPPIPPRPRPAVVDLASDRVVLALSGGPENARRSVESTLLEALPAQGIEVRLAAAEGAGLGSGDSGRLAALGRRHAAGTVVVAVLQAEAQPSVGRFYTGRATVDLRVYDGGSGILRSVRTADVGGTGGRGELAPTETSAVQKAAIEAGRRAAAEIAAALPDGGSR